VFNDIRIDGLLQDRRARRFWKRHLWGEVIPRSRSCVCVCADHAVQESVTWRTMRSLLNAELDLVGRYQNLGNRRAKNAPAPPAVAAATGAAAAVMSSKSVPDGAIAADDYDDGRWTWWCATWWCVR
jgi:hypothetical protein